MNSLGRKVPLDLHIFLEAGENVGEFGGFVHARNDDGNSSDVIRMYSMNSNELTIYAQ